MEGVIGLEDGDCFGVKLFADNEETSLEELGFGMQTVVFLAP